MRVQWTTPTPFLPNTGYESDRGHQEHNSDTRLIENNNVANISTKFVLPNRISVTDVTSHHPSCTTTAERYGNYLKIKRNASGFVDIEGIQIFFCFSNRFFLEKRRQ